ncbi:class A beta-lactamase, subclass A2 [Leptolyngbya sp. FACHB-321]|uniref:class A beta-lactamase, subclass A2 n=1 Tax=Leptolyngbya sp. FACHB-321 TaxID=2692807 RepID=UPI0016843BD3|nr:class A beta-lactamase, subclass A2 [Leptolyngbya sp. FACHB-321]MBD2034045.1 class A beta-lactamase, subclass A2 [Leptolyngbya sp. FACHB-321]
MIQATTKNVSLCLFCLSLLVVGCTSSNSSNRADKRDNQTGAPQEIVAFTTNNENELRARIEQIAQAAQGRVGVTATVLETGESVTLNGEQQFPMQSVYKFPIAMAVLAQVDQGKLKLDQKIHVEVSDVLQGSRILDKKAQGRKFSLAELLKYMVSESDGTSCNVLLRLVGEPRMVTEYLRRLGVNDIVVANTEKELAQDAAVKYRNYATPDATVVLLRAFHEGKGLSKASQALLLQLMTETNTGPKRLKGLLPAGTVVAHKTGTSSTVNGVTAATNDVGLMTLPNGRHLAIAVFVSDSMANETRREEVIAKVAQAAWDEWSK